MCIMYQTLCIINSSIEYLFFSFFQVSPLINTISLSFDLCDPCKNLNLLCYLPFDHIGSFDHTYLQEQLTEINLKNFCQFVQKRQREGKGEKNEKGSCKAFCFIRKRNNNFFLYPYHPVAL